MGTSILKGSVCFMTAQWVHHEGSIQFDFLKLTPSTLDHGCINNDNNDKTSKIYVYLLLVKTIGIAGRLSL